MTTPADHNHCTARTPVYIYTLQTITCLASCQLKKKVHLCSFLIDIMCDNRLLVHSMSSATSVFCSYLCASAWGGGRSQTLDVSRFLCAMPRGISSSTSMSLTQARQHVESRMPATAVQYHCTCSILQFMLSAPRYVLFRSLELHLYYCLHVID